MSMQTAKRARLPLYKLTNPGHGLTAGGVQVEVRYYTGAYVRVVELVCRHHFKVLDILPDVVLWLPWLRSYNPTVNWKERYTDVRHGSSSYRLSFNESRHSTQLRFQAALKLDLLSALSSSTSRASPVESPTQHAKEPPDLHSSTHAQSGADTFDESETAPMRSAATRRSSTSCCQNLSGRSAELISPVIKCFCAACLDPQCRWIKCTRCKKAVIMTGLTPFDASCPF